MSLLMDALKKAEQANTDKPTKTDEQTSSQASKVTTPATATRKKKTSSSDALLSLTEHQIEKPQQTSPITLSLGEITADPIRESTESSTETLTLAPQDSLKQADLTIKTLETNPSNTIPEKITPSQEPTPENSTQEKTLEDLLNEEPGFTALKESESLLDPEFEQMKSTSEHAEKTENTENTKISPSADNTQKMAKSFFTAKKPGAHPLKKTVLMSLGGGLAILCLMGGGWFYYSIQSADIIAEATPLRLKSKPLNQAIFKQPTDKAIAPITAKPRQPTINDSMPKKETPLKNTLVAADKTRPAPANNSLTKKIAEKTPQKNKQRTSTPVQPKRTTQAIQRKTSKVIKQPSKPANKKPSKKRLTATTPPIDPIKTFSIDQLVKKAYTAFHKGHVLHAKSLYQHVLLKEKNHQDALLGMAAISLVEKQYPQARERYLSVLDINPDNSVAQAGLLNLITTANPDTLISQLKLLRQRNPGSAYLAFTLGNLYTRQSRWVDAKEAFEQALNISPEHLDYAFNLAISLEHLGNHREALRYYQQILAAETIAQSRLNLLTIQQRIHALTTVLPVTP
jgi:Tfp pilus assembly protein PilF